MPVSLTVLTRKNYRNKSVQEFVKKEPLLLLIIVYTTNSNFGILLHSYHLVSSWFYISFEFYCKVWKRRFWSWRCFLYQCCLIFPLISEFFDVPCTIKQFRRTFVLSPLKLCFCAQVSREMTFERKECVKEVGLDCFFLTQLCRYPSFLKSVIKHVQKNAISSVKLLFSYNPGN